MIGYTELPSSLLLKQFSFNSSLSEMIVSCRERVSVVSVVLARGGEVGRNAVRETLRVLGRCALSLLEQCCHSRALCDFRHPPSGPIVQQ